MSTKRFSLLRQTLLALQEKEEEAQRDRQRLSELEREKADQAYRLELELLETEIRMAQEAKDEVAAAAIMLKEQQFVVIAVVEL